MSSPGSFVVQVGAHQVAIVGSPGAVDVLASLLEDLRVPDGSGRPDETVEVAAHADRVTLRCREGVIGRADAPLEQAIDTLVAWANRRVVANRAGLVSLHAGAVIDRAGRTVVITGPSGAGKSTLTLAGLATAGWRYLSDEIVSFAPDGTVLPHAKPITVKAGTIEQLRSLAIDGLGRVPTGTERRHLTPAAVGAVAAPSGGRVCGVVVLRSDVSGPPTRLSPAEALYELARNTAHDLDRGALVRLGELGSTVPVVALPRGRLAAAVAVVDTVASERVDGEIARPVRVLGTDRTSGPTHGPVVVDGLDAVTLLGGVVVHRRRDRLLTLLDATAASVWELLDGSRDRDRIIDELDRRFLGGRDVIAADVDRLLQRLQSLDLLAPDGR